MADFKTAAKVLLFFDICKFLSEKKQKKCQKHKAILGLS